MKLDRNVNEDGHGKYALLLLRCYADLYQPSGAFEETEVTKAIKLLDEEGLIDWGDAGTEREFFVLRLRDRFARAALVAYADDAWTNDPEYAGEVRQLADRSGPSSPFCKAPD